MRASRRMQTGRLVLAALVVHVAVASAYSLAANQASPSKPAQPPNQTAQGNQEQVEDIVKDTMELLDVLDAKLAFVGNRTAGALVRDNLRALDEAAGGPAAAEESLELALARLADNFSSARKQAPDEQTAEESAPTVLAQADVELDPSQQQQQADSPLGGQRRWSARQLAAGEELQSASDSTERHIKFTLDLMQAIFAAQSYTSKSNQIESFLISPLSIQVVLMMMHLGARGQTRRELANCLHLYAAGGLAGAPSNKSLAQASAEPQALEGPQVSSAGAKLKRRHPQAPNSERNAKTSTARPPRQTQQPQAQQQQPQPQPQSAHELFGAALRNLLKDATVTKALTSANQILMQRNLPLAPQYDWAVRHYYAADVRPVDFQRQSAATTNGSSQASDTSNNNIQQLVNEWVERQTRGRISNLLSAPVAPSTLLMAVNALFFKGDWQYSFDPADTETDAFFTQADGRTVRLPMMVNRLPVAFAHDPAMRTSVIELPYKAQRLGLFLLLPDEVAGIFHTMQMLNSTSFANLIASMRKPSQAQPASGAVSPAASPADAANNGINVRIPKFSIEASPRLSQVLSQQLGLKTLFAADVADLSGMFAQPKRPANSSQGDSAPQTPSQAGLDELVHKAVLQVDEQGSVAAAASATIVERVGLFNSNYFEADHPFLLFLMDKQTGLVLFSGVFAGNNPSAQEQHSAGAEPNLQNQRRHHQQTPLAQRSQ